MGEWSRQKNLESETKAKIKTEFRLAELQETQDELRDANLARLRDRIADRIAAGDAAEPVVRAIVEGEVYTHSEEARKAHEELADLDYELFERQSELAILEPRYKKAAEAHTQAIASSQAVAGLDRRDDIPHQARVPLWIALGILLLLETFFQRRPVELIVRDQWPEFSDALVSWSSLVASALAVGLSTMSLYIAARSWGEYAARRRRADDTARDATGTVVGEEVSPVSALFATACAAVAQVVLFMLRFQTGASDSSTRTNLIFISALVMFAAASVAILEFRSSLETETLKLPATTNAEQIISGYMNLHREVHAMIPRRHAEVEQKRIMAILAFLRTLQRVGNGLGPEVRDAVQRLIAEYETEHEGVKKVEYLPPSLPRSGSVDVSDVAGGRAI